MFRAWYNGCGCGYRVSLIKLMTLSFVPHLYNLIKMRPGHIWTLPLTWAVLQLSTGYCCWITLCNWIEYTRCTIPTLLSLHCSSSEGGCTERSYLISSFIVYSCTRAKIIAFFPPIFLSSNSFFSYLLFQIFCS